MDSFSIYDLYRSTSTLNSIAPSLTTTLVNDVIEKPTLERKLTIKVSPSCPQTIEINTDLTPASVNCEGKSSPVTVNVNLFYVLHRKIKNHIKSVKLENEQEIRNYFLNLLNSDFPIHPYFKEVLRKIYFDDYELNDTVIEKYYDDAINGEITSYWLNGQEPPVFKLRNHKCLKVYKLFGYK